MKITVRKSRGANLYTIKVDNVLIESFETKTEALNFVDVNKDKLEDLKNKMIDLNKNKSKSEPEPKSEPKSEPESKQNK